MNRSPAFVFKLTPLTIAIFCSSLCLSWSEDELASQADLKATVEALPETGRSDGAWNVGFTLGAGVGMEALGSHQGHDLALATVHVGKLLTPSLELAGELWGGGQYHPDDAYVAGLTPILRFHLRPERRWDPFLDLGAGVTFTDIGGPDLSTTFEFNLQGGAGFQWRFYDGLAFTVQTRYLHLSNAGIAVPNCGVNTFVFSGGLTWFF